MWKGLTALAATEFAAIGRHKASQYGLYATAVLLVVGAIAFGLDGLHTILAASYGQVVASFVIAGGLLLTALIVFLFGKLMNRRRRNGAELVAATAIAAAPIAAQLLAPNTMKKAGALGAFAIAALLGRNLGSS